MKREEALAETRKKPIVFPSEARVLTRIQDGTIFEINHDSDVVVDIGTAG